MSDNPRVTNAEIIRKIETLCTQMNKVSDGLVKLAERFDKLLSDVHDIKLNTAVHHERLDQIDIWKTGFVKQEKEDIASVRQSSGSNKLTFQWVLEQLALPIILLLAGYLLGKGL